MNVTRQRRLRERSGALKALFGSKRFRIVAAAGCALAITSGGIATASTIALGNHTVGSTYSDGSQQVSDNQTINPRGDRLMTPFGKIMGSAISPNGKILATTSTDHSIDVQMFNMDTYQPVSAAGQAPLGNASTANTFVNAAVNAGFPSMTYVNTPQGGAIPAGNTNPEANPVTACTPTTDGSGNPTPDGTVGQGNPTWSPDGSQLWVPVSCGFDVYNVDATGNLSLSTPAVFRLPVVHADNPIIFGNTANPIQYTKNELPLTAGSVFGPNGHLYAALNGQNVVDEINPSDGSVVNQWSVGVAPRQLGFAGGKLYVANEGGKADASGMQSYGTKVASDGVKGTTTTGTVSVIDPAVTTGVAATINVGLHPTAMYTSGTTVYVANTNDDTVSVINSASNNVVQTISTQPWAGSTVGYEPDGIDVVGSHLLVSLGRANAIEVFGLGTSAQDPVSQIGLIPTDYYPSGVFTDSSGKIVVANRRGIDSRGTKLSFGAGAQQPTVSGHGTHSTTASLTRFAFPSDTTIKADSATVVAQNGWSADPSRDTTQQVTNCTPVNTKVKLTGAALKRAKQSIKRIQKHNKRVRAYNKRHKKDHKKKALPKLYKIVTSQRCGTSTVPVPDNNPVPQTVGTKSSAIKHVFLIVKENRTYDQLYGDMKQGNGDPTLAQFGQEVTPNQHALATQFGLYDNTYDIGTNSAEGHNWMMMGDNPEYTESSAGEYTRSYDTEEDVLGHQRSGFLWTAVQAAGNTARNYGEYLYGEGKPGNPTVANSPAWQQYYCASVAYDSSGDASQLTAGALSGSHYGSAIPSLNAITNPLSPSYDNSIPDIYREAMWQQDFNSELSSAGGVPNFNMIWYSDDHTSNQASPEAQVADNDLAVGQTIDRISHSPIWKDSVIFVAEDDSQAGADHVDGHRAPIQVVSPYAVHGKTVSTFYSQISMVRTIEQLLGATPLNQKVAAATPMYDAFTATPDLTPYNAVANEIPLTEGLAGGVPACGNDNLGQSGAKAAAVQARAAAATSVPSSEQTVADQWDAWATHQHFTGDTAVADYANPELMNRYTWYRAHDWSTPYPGDKSILAPSQVPGGYVPSSDTE